MKNYPQSFEDWFHDIGDRAISELGSNAGKWLHAAWILGQIENERTSDGYAAEALSAVKDAGGDGPEIVESIKNKVYAESEDCIKSNIKVYASRHPNLDDLIK